MTAKKKSMTINERIKYVQKQLEYSDESFANKLGVSKQGITNVTSEKGSDPSFKLIQAIVKVFPVSEEWLLLGYGEPFTIDDITPFVYSERVIEPFLDLEVNARIKQIRLEEGLNQSLFANEINVTRNVLAFVEGGRQSITIPTLKRILDRFKINPMWLLYGVGNKHRKG